MGGGSYQLARVGGFRLFLLRFGFEKLSDPKVGGNSRLRWQKLYKTFQSSGLTVLCVRWVGVIGLKLNGP